MTAKMAVEMIGVVEVTSDYWECECGRDFVHPSDEMSCEKCGSFKEDCPDARVENVLRAEYLVSGGSVCPKIDKPEKGK